MNNYYGHNRCNNNGNKASSECNCIYNLSNTWMEDIEETYWSCYIIDNRSNTYVVFWLAILDKITNKEDN